MWARRRKGSIQGSSDGLPQVPGYRDFTEIGRGASATVYRAWEEHFERWVAIKVLSVDLQSRKTQQRYARERVITGRLSNHPHVVTVFDAGLLGGRRPYLAMALFEQGALSERIARRGPLPTDEVLRIGIKIAGALETAHRASILHRDIKPQNILMSRFDEPALADFGIATLLEPDASMTAGLTPAHAAPELLEGDPPSVASDVYALGSTVFTLLTGKPPFAGPPGEGVLPQLRRIMSSDLPPLPAEVPASLREVLRRAMAKSPELRHASAVAFGDALQAEQRASGQPVTEMVLEGIGDVDIARRPAPGGAGSPLGAVEEEEGSQAEPEGHTLPSSFARGAPAHARGPEPPQYVAPPQRSAAPQHPPAPDQPAPPDQSAVPNPPAPPNQPASLQYPAPPHQPAPQQPASAQEPAPPEYLTPPTQPGAPDPPAPPEHLAPPEQPAPQQPAPQQPAPAQQPALQQQASAQQPAPPDQWAAPNPPAPPSRPAPAEQPAPPQASAAPSQPAPPQHPPPTPDRPAHAQRPAPAPAAAALPAGDPLAQATNTRGPDGPTVLGRPHAPRPDPIPKRSRRPLVLAAGATVVVVAAAAVALSGALGGRHHSPSAHRVRVKTASGTLGPVARTAQVSPTTNPETSTSPSDTASLAPTGVKATIGDNRVLLDWTDHTGGKAPQLIYTYPAAKNALPQQVPKGATSAVVNGASPTAPECFVVDAVVGIGSSGAKVASSAAACINGAVATP